MTVRYDRARVLRVLDFLRKLEHVEGHLAGEPLILDDWQVDKIIKPIFGYIHPKPDAEPDDPAPPWVRVVSKAYLWIAKKNTKSTLAAALALYMTGWDGEQGARVFSAAADKLQAGVVFETARKMAKDAHPDIERQLVVYKNKITHPATNSSYEVVSSDTKTKHGPNLHGLFFDELHTQPTRTLWDTLTPAGAARLQPLVFAMSTAGEDRASLAYEQYDYCKRVMAGDIEDPATYAAIYEADPEDDWESEDTWRKANPGLGKSVQLSFLRKEAREAKHIPSKLNSFLRLHLNMWVQGSGTWIPMEEWDKCIGPTRPPLPGEICYGGLDLASTRDMCAWVKVFPQTGEDGVKRLRIEADLWTPEARLEDPRNLYAAQYQAWVKKGLLRTVPGSAMEYGPIEHQIIADSKMYFLDSANADRLYQAYEVIQRIQGHGIQMIPFGQGFYSMGMPMHELDLQIGHGRLDHQGNELLRWQAQNMAASEDAAGNKKPDKQKATATIDGIVALVMAMDRYVQREGGLDNEKARLITVL